MPRGPWVSASVCGSGGVHLPNRFLAPRVQVFLDFVKEALGRQVSPYRADWDNR